MVRAYKQKERGYYIKKNCEMEATANRLRWRLKYDGKTWFLEQLPGHKKLVYAIILPLNML